ncbi:hypothetical protein LVJ94_06350 [Pendulispora rubella]|uniref:Uncharacterized protein n=1 Tax=Pendulispora rubella TaxID=2741070 RepID=A0ABZ2LBB8_9BACT
MTVPLPLVIGGFVALAVVAWLFSSFVSKAARGVATKRLDRSVGASSYSEAELRAQALGHDDWFAPLTRLLGDERIVGVVEAGFPKSAAGAAVRGLFNFVGQFAGVKVVDKDCGVYLALSATHLHYIVFERGQVEEHVTWQRARVSEIAMRESLEVSEKKYGALVVFDRELTFVADQQRFVIPVASFISRGPRTRPPFGPPREAQPMLHALSKGFLREFESAPAPMQRSS